MQGGFEDFIDQKTCPSFVLIQQVEYEDSDVLLPVVAVDDKRVLYGFGKDFGKLYITGILCLYAGEGRKQIIATLQKAFDKARATKNGKPITVSHGPSGLTIKFYAAGIKLFNANPNANHISFGITGLVAPVTNSN